MQALGMIETYGLVPAVNALDVMLKTACVTLVGRYQTGSGLITVIVEGDVSAASAAVTAGQQAAMCFNALRACHVIPRPFDEIRPLLSKKTENRQSAYTLTQLMSMDIKALRALAAEVGEPYTDEKIIKYSSKRLLAEYVLRH